MVNDKATYFEWYVLAAVYIKGLVSALLPKELFRLQQGDARSAWPEVRRLESRGWDSVLHRFPQASSFSLFLRA